MVTFQLNQCVEQADSLVNHHGYPEFLCSCLWGDRYSLCMGHSGERHSHFENRLRGNFDPLLTQNGIGRGSSGRKQRNICPTNSGKQYKTEPKWLCFFAETTYGPVDKGGENVRSMVE